MKGDISTENIFMDLSPACLTNPHQMFQDVQLFTLKHNIIMIQMQIFVKYIYEYIDLFVYTMNFSSYFAFSLHKRLLFAHECYVISFSVGYHSISYICNGEGGGGGSVSGYTMESWHQGTSTGISM